MSAFLTLLAALAAFWAHGVPAVQRRPGFRSSLRGFAVGSLATAAALALASRNALAPARPLLLGLAAAAALAAWTGLIRLVSFETRRRDLPGRCLCLGLAALSSALNAPEILTASLAMSGIMTWRWNRELKTRARFTIGMIALALGLVLSTHLGHVFARGTLSGAPEAWHRFARWVLIASTFYALFGALALLRAWASDPSLGIRTVSRRLALSHVLVGLVPLLLVVALWTMTTVLGVLNERAIVGARAVASLGRSYRTQLAAALRNPAEAESRLKALPAALDSTAGIRVWRRSGLTLRRVAGAPIGGELRLSAWVDSLASLRDAGVVRLEDSMFVGAAASGPAGGAVLLAPVRAALGSLPDSVARARLSMWHRALTRKQGSGVAVGGRDSPEAGEQVAVPSASPDSADSARAASLRHTLRRLGLPDRSVTINTRESSRGVSVSVPGRSVQVENPESFFVQGHAIVDGIDWTGGGWRTAQFMLTARAAPAEILSGLARDVKTNLLGLLPLVMVGLFSIVALLVVAWDLMIVRGMGGSITLAVAALRGAAERLSAGDLSHRIAIAGEDDLWQVAAAFNAATEGLSRARDAEKEQQRIEDELDVARRIQERLLPAAAPRVRGLDITGYYDPAREVGGDYYDHIALDGRRVLVVIADVSGKSVPAALIMAGFRAALVSQDLTTVDPVALAGRLNGFLNASLDPGKFVTAFIAVIDGESGRVAYVNAGHNPPVLLRTGGACEMLATGGTILGISPESAYEPGETTMAPGDLLVLYTDGVTEATSPSSELWGDERLIATLRACSGEPCGPLVRAIADAVRAFEAERGPTDDVTLIAVRHTRD